MVRHERFFFKFEFTSVTDMGKVRFSGALVENRIVSDTTESRERFRLASVSRPAATILLTRLSAAGFSAPALAVDFLAGRIRSTLDLPLRSSIVDLSRGRRCFLQNNDNNSCNRRDNVD